MDRSCWPLPQYTLRYISYWCLCARYTSTSISVKVEEYADEVFDRLDKGAHIYFCGLKGMMPGILTMLEGVAKKKKMVWEDVLKKLKTKGKLRAPPRLPVRQVYRHRRNPSTYFLRMHDDFGCIALLIPYIARMFSPWRLVPHVPPPAQVSGTSRCTRFLSTCPRRMSDARSSYFFSSDSFVEGCRPAKKRVARIAGQYPFSVTRFTPERSTTDTMRSFLYRVRSPSVCRWSRGYLSKQADIWLYSFPLKACGGRDLGRQEAC